MVKILGKGKLQFNLCLVPKPLNVAAKSSLQMIKELVCCLVDLRLRVRDIKQQVRKLSKLKFLKRPLKRSLRFSVYTPVNAHANHAMSYTLPYLVSNYLQLCLG